VNYLELILSPIAAPWKTWTPTLTWVGGTPSSVATIAKYKVVGKLAFIQIRITATNGNNATACYASLPTDAAPKVNNMNPHLYGMVLVGGTGATARPGRVRDDGTNNDVTYWSMGTATSGQALDAYLSGFYEKA